MADSTFPDRIINSILGRIFILSTQTVLTSLVLLLAVLFRQAVDLTLLKYTIVLLIGLMAGFSARRFLKGHSHTLKFLSALSSTALSLAVLYPLSAGFLGISLFSRSTALPDWQGLIQLGTAASGALLVVLAFRTRPPVVGQPVIAPPAGIASSSPGPDLRPIPAVVGAKKSSPKSTSGKTKVTEPPPGKSSSALKVAPSKAVQKADPKKAAAKKTKQTPAPAKLMAAPPPALKKRSSRAKKKVNKEIKLVGEMEHTCPYCLDPVIDHDPRGVKICPICKTRHHADCWGITGACQIPHSHA